MISPVRLSSLLKTGHEAPSALASVTSSFVPMILNFEVAGSIAPKRGMVAVYRFGGASVVGRFKDISVGVNSIFALSLLTFFRKNEAMTVLAV